MFLRITLFDIWVWINVGIICIVVIGLLIGLCSHGSADSSSSGGYFFWSSDDCDSSGDCNSE